jgi:hypothetical protein
MAGTSMKRTFRYLRIAWSVVCGIFCVLLIVLWVRSYWYVDIGFFKVTNGVFLYGGSMPGTFGFHIYPEEYVPTGMRHLPAEEWRRARPKREGLGLLGTFRIDDQEVLVPYWFWLLIPAAVAVAPWLPWWSKRFSLRTLLIAMTLVAVVLGLIVWLVR